MSPVLISMCVVSLVKQGYGAKTGIVSILLAASTVDNNLVIVIFEIFNETLQHTSMGQSCKFDGCDDLFFLPLNRRIPRAICKH